MDEKYENALMAHHFDNKLGMCKCKCKFFVGVLSLAAAGNTRLGASTLYRKMYKLKCVFF